MSEIIWIIKCEKNWNHIVLAYAAAHFRERTYLPVILSATIFRAKYLEKHTHLKSN